MKNLTAGLYAVVYCVLSGCVGTIVGAVAGTGIAGILLEPEEAVVAYTGVTLGGPLGALVGITLGALAMIRRRRRNSRQDPLT